MYYLRVLLIVAPLICAAITIIMPIVREVDFDYKWTVMCLCISLLAFSVDRLELLKIFGLEAKLSKLDEATKKAYATIQEVEKSRQEMRSLGEILVFQQAMTIMKANRFVGEDFVSERAEAIHPLFDMLETINASKETIQRTNEVVATYIRIDLNHNAFERVKEVLGQSEIIEQCFAQIGVTPHFDPLCNGYEIGKTLEKVRSYLNEIDVEMADDIQYSFRRLDSFLQNGELLDISENKILTVQDPLGVYRGSYNP